MADDTISPNVFDRLRHRAHIEGLSVDDLLGRLLDDAPAPPPDLALSQEILEAIDAAIFVFDLDYRYCYANRVVGEMAGIDHRQMIGKTDRELGMSEVLVERWQAAWQVAIDTHQTQIVDFDYATPQGTRTYETHMTPILDATGTVQYLLAMVSDITERRETENLLKNITDQLPGMILRYERKADGSASVPFLSAGVANIYELSQEEALADLSRIWAKVHPEDRQEFEASIRRSAEHLTVWCYDWRIIMNDGSIKWISGRGTPYRLDDGGTMWNTLLLDITASKRAEQLHREQERLKTSLKSQQEYNMLVQKAISALAHDLRTPLAAIATTKDLLARYADRMTEEQRRQKLANIGHQLKFVVKVLDDTVAAVRGNLSEHAFHPLPVNLDMLCQVTVDQMREMVKSERRIQYINKGQITDVLLDEVLVSRILLNLFSNAIKYSSPDSAIELVLDRRDDWLRLSVRDEGWGIAPENLPHIFEPFYRAEDALSVHGSGLGLSIVQECVQRHQGRLSVESVLDEGTTFHIEIPFSEADTIHRPIADVS